MRLLTTLLVVYCWSARAQDTAAIKSFTFYSSILKEERQFTIYLPPPTTGKPEVIYVLDGQALFSQVLNAMKAVGQTQKIVVGIGNIWLRDRDYTPTHVNASPFLTAQAAAVSGGGPKFINHLKHELVPYMNANYRAAASGNMLIGHSLGGLTAIDILFNHPNLFTKYAVIDPSVWWDDDRFVKQANLLAPGAFKNASVFLAIANTKDHDKKDIEEIRKDTTLHTAQIRPSVALLGYLKPGSKNSEQLGWKYYKEHDHMSVFVPAVTDALKFLLNK